MIDSASTILVRGWDSADAYLVLRDAKQRAFPSTWVFAGGRVDEADCQLEVRGLPEGGSVSCYGAAARELFEEVGVLLATGRTQRELDAQALAQARRELLDDKISFGEVLTRLDAVLDASLLKPLGIKSTPPFAPRRFRNQFFIGVLPEGQEPSVLVEGELEAGQWMQAGDWVSRFEKGELLLAPPVLLLLDILARGGAGGALAELQNFSDETFADKPVHIRYTPDVLIFPGKTPTLPPATHTNTYIIGREKLLVVDPATDEPTDRKKLLMLLDELAAQGRKVEAVVVTHHHRDHIGAVELVAQHTGAPVWAHPLCVPRLAPTHVARTLVGGETIDLGTAGNVHVLHTPGHTRDHLVLFVERCRDLIAGDMVSTISTIIIDPPEGELTDYLESLERMRKLEARMLHPAHGAPTALVDTTLRHFIEHRRFREEKTLAALTPDARPLSDLVQTVYSDVDARVYPIAERNLLANLLKLEREGRAISSGGGLWRAKA